jgi:hypothetical protein
MIERAARGLLITALSLVPATAWAQTAAPEAAAPASTETTVRTENGRRVYVASTTIEVRGEIQRPYAFSVSGRSSLGYTYFDQPIQFLQLILDAVRRAPF